jgi:5-aminopentanamidase
MTGGGITVAVAQGRQPAAMAAAAARVAGADLLVLQRRPEAPAEASDGALAHAMGELALRHAIAILFAYGETCSGHAHLALQLVLDDGRSTANYRATHLDTAAAAAGWTPGSWLTMARLEPLTLGLMAGIDHLAPEVGRALSSLGAEALIAVADPSSPSDALSAGALLAPLARLRAIENGVPVCIIGPDGMLHAAPADGAPLAAREAQGLRLVALPTGERAAAVPRRPDLYRQLVEGAPDRFA